MARPLKTGIDYFPLDVDFLSDIKIRKLMRGIGTESIGVIISILSNIYRDNGYFISVDDDFYFLIAEEVGTTELIVEKVVKKSLDIDFFEPELFNDFKILTSLGIQKRYLQACEKRKVIEFESNYLLLTNFDNPRVKVVNNLVNSDKSGINGVKDDNNSVNYPRSTQSKVKESKVNNTKVNYNENDVVDENVTQENSSINPNDVIEFYQNNFGMMSPYVMENISRWCDDINAEVVLEACKISVAMGKTNYNYVNGVLKNWLKRNVKSVDDVKALQVAHENQKQQVSYNRRSNHVEAEPEWLNQEETTVAVPKEAMDLDEEELKARLARLKKKE